MIKKITLLTLSVMSLVFGLDSYYNTAFSEDNGVPAGNTGSPDDGRTCARSTCHGSSSNHGNRDSLILSDIPIEGYVPGNTYTITGRVDTGGFIFGFQISPQDDQGNLIGSMAVININETKLVGNNKYITHKFAGISGNGGKTWDFEWTAPAAGTGNVTFYGAFNCANGDGMAVGDKIYTSTMTVSEKTTSAVERTVYQDRSRIVAYPNPATDFISVGYALQDNQAVTVQLVNHAGQVLQTPVSRMQAPGVYDQRMNLMGYEKGMYFVQVVIGDVVTTHRVLVL